MIMPMLLGMLAGAGVLLIARTFMPPARPDAAEALERLTPDVLTASLHRRETPPDPTSISERLGLWIEETLGTRPGFRAPLADLELIEMTPRAFYTRKALCALTGLILPLMASMMLAMLGIGGVGLPVILTLAVAVFFWFIPDGEVKDKAKLARADFARSSVAFLQLVAIARRSGSAPGEALDAAAGVSQTWTFRRINEELASARLRGVTPWEGLKRLGTRLRVPELEETAEIMRQAAEHGSEVSEQLMARAAGLRDRILNAEHLEASDTTTKLAGPNVALLGLFGASLAYPLLTGLLGA